MTNAKHTYHIVDSVASNGQKSSILSVSRMCWRRLRKTRGTRSVAVLLIADRDLVQYERVAMEILFKQIAIHY